MAVVDAFFTKCGKVVAAGLATGDGKESFNELGGCLILLGLFGHVIDNPPMTQVALSAPALQAERALCVRAESLARQIQPALRTPLRYQDDHP
jgi:hypothetical protein